jgi:hypothetical protein
VAAFFGEGQGGNRLAFFEGGNCLVSSKLGSPCRPFLILKSVSHYFDFLRI